MSKLSLLVSCHKKSDDIRTQNPYKPIQAGKNEHPELDLGFICDNKGDNISPKNTSYSSTYKYHVSRRCVLRT